MRVRVATARRPSFATVYPIVGTHAGRAHVLPMHAVDSAERVYADRIPDACTLSDAYVDNAWMRAQMHARGTCEQTGILFRRK